MKRAAVAGVFILALLSAFTLYCLYPFYCMRQLAQALRQRDLERVADYVDFDSLRASLKQEASAKLEEMAARNRQAQKNTFAASLAAALGPTLVNNMVDHLATPSGLAIAMQKIQASEPQTSQEGPQSSLTDSWKKISVKSLGEITYDEPRKGVSTFNLTGGRWRLTRYKPRPELIEKLLAQ